MLYEYSDRIKELIEIAFIDQSASYEVDMTGIYFDQKLNKFCIITASGCSCWSGEYEETQHESLEECFNILEEGKREHNPSLKGLEELKQQVKNFSEKENL